MSRHAHPSEVGLLYACASARKINWKGVQVVQCRRDLVCGDPFDEVHHDVRLFNTAFAARRENYALTVSARSDISLNIDRTRRSVTPFPLETEAIPNAGPDGD